MRVGRIGAHKPSVDPAFAIELLADRQRLDIIDRKADQPDARNRVFNVDGRDVITQFSTSVVAGAGTNRSQVAGDERDNARRSPDDC